MIEFKTDGLIARIRLNSPKINLISRDVLKSISEILDKLTDEKVLVISGNKKAFAAGADIKEMSSMTPEEAKEFSALGQSLFSRIEDLDILTVAVIDGFCYGGGLELALSCDIKIVGHSAKFALPELKLGVIPGFGAFYRVARLVGKSKLSWMIYTGKPINAETAVSSGLADHLADDPEGYADSLCREFLKVSFNAFQRSKEMISSISSLSRDEAMAKEQWLITECFSKRSSPLIFGKH